MNVHDLLMAHAADGLIKDWELWAVEVVVDDAVVFAHGVKVIGKVGGKSIGEIGGKLYETTGAERVDVLVPIWQETVCSIVGVDTTGIVVIPHNSKLELILPLDTLVWPLPL